MRYAFAPGIFAAWKIFEKFPKSISVLNPILCDRGMRKIAPTFEESVNFSKGVSFYPPILCDREVRGISSRAVVFESQSVTKGSDEKAQ